MYTILINCEGVKVHPNCIVMVYSTYDLLPTGSLEVLQKYQLRGQECVLNGRDSLLFNLLHEDC
jgi:hypothetical protein